MKAQRHKNKGGRNVIQGRGVMPGRADGFALVSARPFMFAHGVDPGTGKIIDVRSDLLDETMKGKVLVFAFGKGSTTGSAWLLETIRQANGPAAIVNIETEPIIVTALILANRLYDVEIPLVDRIDVQAMQLLETDTLLRVDGDAGTITLLGGHSL
jgi:predicted aconitase with swiveling domain